MFDFQGLDVGADLKQPGMEEVEPPSQLVPLPLHRGLADYLPGGLAAFPLLTRDRLLFGLLLVQLDGRGLPLARARLSRSPYRSATCEVGQ